jgi:glycosyltransferase involved in cell wall biosynthesis
MALSPRTPGVKLLHLLPSFDYHAAAEQVALLASGLRSLTLPARLELHVAALGPDGPLATPLRTAGIPVHILGTDRRLEPARWWRLRQLVADLRPDVVHAWRVPALRAAGALRLFPRQSFRLVVSEPRRGGSLNALDRWLLRGADAVVAAHSTDAAALRRIGVPAERVHVLPPAVAVLPPGEPPSLDLPLPPGAKVVMCIGSLTPAHGFYDAVWAADILKYAVPELQLVIVGDGPDRDRLRQFMRRVHRAWGGEFVHLLPARTDAAALLPRADVVWVPSRTDCGRQVLLEAMAAGRPVAASALPGLAALVRDRVTGLLTPKGDPPTLTRQTRQLLDDPELARRLGDAARQAVAGNAPERVAAAYVELLSWRTPA